MGCDDYPIIAGRYQTVGEPVAVQWNPDLEQRFPRADHHGCLQSMTFDAETDTWRRHEPPICHGYHCPRCGAAVGSMGHRTCT